MAASVVQKVKPLGGFLGSQDAHAANATAVDSSDTATKTLTNVNERFYELQPLDSTDEPFPFEQLRGKVVLIVNVASKCGFTPQYKDLENLSKKFSSRGLQIIAFPSNSFKQERANQDKIVQFCYLNFGIDFPIMKKISVNGVNTDPVYKYLKSEKSGFLGIKSVKWNFEKFLINRKGEIVARYSSLTNPSHLEAKIEKLLSEDEEEEFA